MNRRSTLFLLLFLTAVLAQAQRPAVPRTLPVANQQTALRKLYPGITGNWAENTLNSLSLEEKIGQLFMAQAYTRAENYNRREIEQLIEKYKIGGLIFMQGGPMREAYLTNHYQQLSDLPLMVSMDAEWGLSFRLDSTIRFPRNMTLGALQNDSLIYQYGRIMAQQCRAVGVHINFAPVVDVNNNARNPVINDRSFGENKHNVTRKALLLMQGMQDGGVIAVAKHFPGHGDTDTDSHLDLPVIKHPKARLDTLELYPFKQLARNGVMGMMVAHLYIPALDTTSGLPTTLSPRIVQGLLRDSLQYRGLCFTDALTMKGVTKFFPPGRIELQALIAGNDIMLIPDNVGLAIHTIKMAVLDSVISEELIDERVRRVLYAKEWLGIHKNRMIQPQAVMPTLRAPQAEQLRRRLYQEAVVLAHNAGGLLPLTGLEQKKIAYLEIASDKPSELYAHLRKYAGIDWVPVPNYLTKRMQDSILLKLRGYNTVVMGLLQLTRLQPPTYGISPDTRDLLCQLAKTKTSLIACVFGNSYALEWLPPETQAIVMAHERYSETQQAVAELIFAGQCSNSQLAVTPNGRKLGPAGYDRSVQRFRLGQAQAAGLDTVKLASIDTFLNRMVAQRAMPGCAVLVLRGGQVVYDRAFGYYDYLQQQAVSTHTQYDIASITKVAATTLVAMRLFEQGKLQLGAKLERYYPQLAGKPLGQATLQQLLQHESGLPPFVPFWQQAVVNGVHNPDVVQRTISEKYCIPLGDSLYLHKDYPDLVFGHILNTPLQQAPGERMVYSDLGMIILARVLEQLVGMPLEWYLQREFYGPLGMQHTVFHPALKCMGYAPAPTEADKLFRLGTVQGYVHDPTAALLGGAAGHAGLFSTTYDLAKLLTMLQNGGVYGGRRYLDSVTVRYFTTMQHSKNRRGLGWDKPEMDKGKPSPCSKYASAGTYGHQGFTGTCVWVDPARQLTYIFLSNRTHPSAENKKFGDESVRTWVMDRLYEAMGVK